MMQNHRPTYEVKTLLHIWIYHTSSLKQVKRNSCLCHFDGQSYLWYDLNLCWLQSWHIPFVINAMLLTLCCLMVLRRSVFNLRNPLNDHSAEHDIILESYAKINSGLEIPQIKGVVVLATWYQLCGIRNSPTSYQVIDRVWEQEARGVVI